MKLNCFQELREEFDKEKIILDETISKEREELRIGREDREKGEQQLEQLSQELDTVDIELAEVKRVNAENEFQMKESYERKVSQIDARIHKLRLENTKYDQENVKSTRGAKDNFFMFLSRKTQLGRWRSWRVWRLK